MLFNRAKCEKASRLDLAWVLFSPDLVPKVKLLPAAPKKAVPSHLNLPRAELPPPRVPEVQLVLEVPGDLQRGRLPPGVFGDAAPRSSIHDPSRGVQGVGLDEAVWCGVQFLASG